MTRNGVLTHWMVVSKGRGVSCQRVRQPPESHERYSRPTLDTADHSPILTDRPFHSPVLNLICDVVIYCHVLRNS